MTIVDTIMKLFAQRGVLVEAGPSPGRGERMAGPAPPGSIRRRGRLQRPAWTGFVAATSIRRASWEIRRTCQAS